MDIEKKTLIYILIGLLYISTTTVIQVSSSNSFAINYLLFGGDNHPDLVIEGASIGATNGEHYNFVYSGHYITETAALAEKNGFHKGLFLFRLGNNNFLEKKYKEIPSNSSIKITAFNDIIFNSDVNQSNHCEYINMTVKQNDEILETLDVKETERLKDFRVKTHDSNSKSSITLTINPNENCGDTPQILGIDQFYLEEPSDSKPVGLVNRVLHKIP